MINTKTNRICFSLRPIKASLGKVGEDQIFVIAKIDSKTLLDSLNSFRQIVEKTIKHFIAWLKQQVENELELLPMR